MKILLLAVFLFVALAEESKPELSVEALKARIELLEAQNEALNKMLANEQQACWHPDLFQSRYAAAMAQKKVNDLAAKQAPKPQPKTPEPTQ